MNGNRKFFLACFGSISSVVLCYLGHMSGDAWVAAQSLVLGLYSAANVTDKKFGGAG